LSQVGIPLEIIVMKAVEVGNLFINVSLVRNWKFGQGLTLGCPAP